MRISKICLISLFALTVFCWRIVLTEAAEVKAADAQGSAGQEAKKSTLLPDLRVGSLDFLPVPKEGGYLESIKIHVANNGKAGAAGCVLGLSCMVAKCNEGSRCGEISSLIQADIIVPALKKGEEIDLAWKPAQSVKWVSGKYSIVASIDKYNTVRESDEANNTIKSMIYITSFSPRAGAENNQP